LFVCLHFTFEHLDLVGHVFVLLFEHVDLLVASVGRVFEHVSVGLELVGLDLDLVGRVFVLSFEHLDVVGLDLDLVGRVFVISLELVDSPESIDQWAVVQTWWWVVATFANWCWWWRRVCIGRGVGDAPICWPFCLPAFPAELLGRMLFVVSFAFGPIALDVVCL